MSFVIPPVDYSANVVTAEYAWKLYDTQTLTKDPPTQNLYHEIFDLSGGCKLHYIAVVQANDEMASKDTDLKFTIDGVTIEETGLSLDVSEIYYVFLADIGQAPPAGTIAVDNSSPLLPFGMRSESSATSKKVEVLPMTDCKLEVKQTEALGTNQTLVVYYRKSLFEAV